MNTLLYYKKETIVPRPRLKNLSILYTNEILYKYSTDTDRFTNFNMGHTNKILSNMSYRKDNRISSKVRKEYSKGETRALRKSNISTSVVKNRKIWPCIIDSL